MYRKSGLSIVFMTLLVVILTSCSNPFAKSDIRNKEVVKIGVPALTSEHFKYDVLKNDLENKLGIIVEYVDLYADLKDMSDSNAYIENIDNLLRNNKIDMCLGVPSYQLESIITNDRLLDITDSIHEIDNIHKGVIDISKKMGNGKLYFISPVILDIYMVFQNEIILDEVNDKLPAYISWNDFLEHLVKNQETISNMNLEYSPMALAVKNVDDEKLFIGYEFFMQALGLGERMIEDNEFTQTAKEFYETFGKIVSNYGKGYEEFENGKYPKNYIFSIGSYAYMLGVSYDFESFFNKSLNNEINKNSPFNINIDFPVGISFINFDGSKTQNLRETTIFINKNTGGKDTCISILNVLLSEDYANKIIESRGEYSHFTSSLFAYPSYYNQETINKLNKSYDKKFDISLLYDVESGNVIYQNVEDMSVVIDLLNEGFTEIYTSEKKDEIDAVISSSLITIEQRLDKIN